MIKICHPERLKDLLRATVCGVEDSSLSLRMTRLFSSIFFLKCRHPVNGSVFKTQFLVGVNLFKSALRHQCCFVETAQNEF
jgi:hypothetical protein